MSSLDIIIPFCHFEEIDLEKLAFFHRQLNEKSSWNFHWILIQDTATPQAKVEDIQSRINPLNLPIDIFFHPKNLGKGAAIQTGLKYSRSDFILYTDADLTYPASVILEFTYKMDSATQPHVVIGHREKTSTLAASRPWKRRILSSLMSWVNHYIWALPVRDTQCGIKIFKKSLLPLVSSIYCKRYLFDWELLMRAEQAQLRVETIEVTPFLHTDSNISSKTLFKELKGFFTSFLIPILTFLIITLLMSKLITGSFYETNPGEYAIRNYVSSDFSSHLHQINHMSFVESWPHEYPLHCGEPNRYHFFYYKIVSFINQLGVPLDWSLNGLSVLSWAGLVFLLIYWCWLLTGSFFVVSLAPLLLYFNSSMNILNLINPNEYYKWPSIPLLWERLWERREFLCFAPYGPGDIAAFWSLHVFLNQRHFIFGLFLFFLCVVFLSQKSRPVIHKIIIISLVVPLLYLLHRPCLMALGIFLFSQFLVPTFTQERKRIFFIGLFSFLIIIACAFIFPSPVIQKPFLKWGYLWGYIPDRPWYDFFTYWFKNLGIYLPFCFLGFFALKRFAKRAILPFFLLIALALNVQFAREMAGNHKFFNIFIIATIPLTLLGLQLFLKKIPTFLGMNYIAGMLLLLALTLGGILDQFFLWRAPYLDVPTNDQKTIIHYLKNHADKGCVITNGLYYAPTTWSGNPVYLTWPYFSWGLGYNTEKRTEEVTSLMRNLDKVEICNLAKKQNVHWLLIEKNADPAGLLPLANPSSYDNILKPTIISASGFYHLYYLPSNCFSRTPLK